jgi:predicted RNase H-like nuclease (RuvC/YqgF family)
VTEKKKTIQHYKEITKKLEKEITELQDENTLLWKMLDEIRESDIKNYTDMLEDITREALTSRLMMSTTKGEA